MAMTKAERERMAALEHELRLAKALRWPTEAPTLIEPPAFMTEGYTRGFWWHCGVDNYRYEPAASSSSSHCRAATEADVEQWVNPATRYTSARAGGSGWSRTLAATRRDALLAIRHEATKQAAELLARIDADIEKEPT